MVKVIEKKERGSIVDKISFPATPDQAKAIKELKNIEAWDINEMFRRYTDELIAEAKKQFGDLDSKAG